MFKPLLAATIFLAAAALSSASAGPYRHAWQEHSPLAMVHKFIDSVNEGNAKAAAATHMSDATIIDEFPPYHWEGDGALSRWDADFGKDMAAKGISSPDMRLGTTEHMNVVGDLAYIVVPGHYTYRQKGKAMEEDGTFAFALKNTADGWRIAGWSWATK